MPLYAGPREPMNIRHAGRGAASGLEVTYQLSAER